MPLPKEQHLVTLIPRSCNIEQMSDRDTNVARSEGLLKVRCWAWSFEERFRRLLRRLCWAAKWGHAPAHSGTSKTRHPLHPHHIQDSCRVPRLNLGVECLIPTGDVKNPRPACRIPCFLCRDGARQPRPSGPGLPSHPTCQIGRLHVTAGAYAARPKPFPNGWSWLLRMRWRGHRGKESVLSFQGNSSSDWSTVRADHPLSATTRMSRG